MKYLNFLRKKLIISLFAIMLALQGVACTQATQALENPDIIIDDTGISYKGKVLPFNENISEWEKILGKARIYESKAEGRYGKKFVVRRYFVWDAIGLVAQNAGNDESLQDKRGETKFEIITEACVFFRNLDSKIGRTGEWDRYLPGGYYNIKPEDLMEKGQTTMTPEQEQRLKFINTDSKKKSDFYIPYQIHKKPILVQGAAIDSTMTVKQLNAFREEKSLTPFHYAPALGGINSSGSQRENTSGKYSGNYKTNFGTEKAWYLLELINWQNEVVYVRIEIYTKKEM